MNGTLVQAVANEIHFNVQVIATTRINGMRRVLWIVSCLMTAVEAVILSWIPMAMVLAGSMAGATAFGAEIEDMPAAPDAIHDTQMLPDSFRLPSDGEDDALSIERAINSLRASGGGAHLVFLPRVYRINSPIRAINPGVFDCSPSGLQQSHAFAGGTTFQIGKAFINSQISPFQFTGSGVIGTKIRGCQFSENQPEPHGDEAWEPVRYPPVIDIDSVPGSIEIDDTTWLGVYSGVRVIHSGRFVANRTQGQWFDVAFDVSYSYDVDRIEDLHAWDYWSDKMGVLRYELRHTDAIRLGRVDSPMLDRIFTFSLRSAIHGVQDPNALDVGSKRMSGGVPTKVQIGTIDCDQGLYCIWNEAPKASFQINQMEAQHLDQTASKITSVSGSADIRLDGWAFVQFGRIYSQHPADAVIALGRDAHGCSQIFGGNLIIDDRDVNDGSLYILNAPSCADDDHTRTTVSLALPPLRFVGQGDVPSEWQAQGSHGRLLWAEPTDHR